jgi:hypothetical protein
LIFRYAFIKNMVHVVSKYFCHHLIENIAQHYRSLVFHRSLVITFRN